MNVISTRRSDSPARTAEIIAHPAVRKITVSEDRRSTIVDLLLSVQFTGSSTVAKLIAAEAAKYLKPCVFELGGKSPVVVGPIIAVLQSIDLTFGIGIGRRRH